MVMFVAMLGGASMAHAAPPSASPLQQCLADAKPSEDGLQHVTGCYQAAYARVDHALDAEYKALQARVKAAHVSAPSLAGGQQAWRRYRDTWCAFEGVGEADAQARGSTVLMCRVEVTQSQLDRLRHAYQR
jgi:uncharacterized protein YecT (DUF1311 family)